MHNSILRWILIATASLGLGLAMVFLVDSCKGKPTYPAPLPTEVAI